jgi:8-oxo-dGTP pyrophosphatase MutT (NUDIX family)
MEQIQHLWNEIQQFVKIGQEIGLSAILLKELFQDALSAPSPTTIVARLRSFPSGRSAVPMSIQAVLDREAAKLKDCLCSIKVIPIVHRSDGTVIGAWTTGSRFGPDPHIQFRLVGGKPNPGEIATQVAIRELKEEAGIICKEIDLTFIGMFKYGSRNANVIVFTINVYEHEIGRFERNGALRTPPIPSIEARGEAITFHILPLEDVISIAFDMKYGDPTMLRTDSLKYARQQYKLYRTHSASTNGLELDIPTVVGLRLLVFPLDSIKDTSLYWDGTLLS